MQNLDVNGLYNPDAESEFIDALLEWVDEGQKKKSQEQKNQNQTKISENEKSEKENNNKKETEGEEIYFKSLFRDEVPTPYNNAPNSSVWEKIKEQTNSSWNNRVVTSRDGEWSYVQKKYQKENRFDFHSRKKKIETPEDVAYIFRSLESEAVEHAFAVYVDSKGDAAVQWISMGSTSSTTVDISLMTNTAIQMQAKDVYFIHNHPSGNLTPSLPDKKILERMEAGFKSLGVVPHAIILNLNSGHYSVFQTDAHTEFRYRLSDVDNQVPMEVYSFSKREFLKSPFDATRIRSSKDVAVFLSQERFAFGDKRGYLFMDSSNKILGNFFATARDRESAVKEIALLSSQLGALQVIEYNNQTADVANMGDYYNALKKDLKNLDVTLLDVISVKKSQDVLNTYESYKSLLDEGRLREKNPAYGASKKTAVNKKSSLIRKKRGRGI